jgi:hypothetical protein
MSSSVKSLVAAPPGSWRGEGGAGAQRAHRWRGGPPQLRLPPFRPRHKLGPSAGSGAPPPRAAPRRPTLEGRVLLDAVLPRDHLQLLQRRRLLAVRLRGRVVPAADGEARLVLGQHLGVGVGGGGCGGMGGGGSPQRLTECARLCPASCASQAAHDPQLHMTLLPLSPPCPRPRSPRPGPVPLAAAPPPPAPPPHLLHRVEAAPRLHHKHRHRVPQRQVGRGRRDRGVVGVAVHEGVELQRAAVLRGPGLIRICQVDDVGDAAGAGRGGRGAPGGGSLRGVATGSKASVGVGVGLCRRPCGLRKRRPRQTPCISHCLYLPLPVSPTARIPHRLQALAPRRGEPRPPGELPPTACR